MTKPPDARTVNPGQAVTYHGSTLSRGVFGEAPQPSNRLRLTVDIAPDPTHPTTWVATCLELGITSAARTPQDAFSAAASGLRLMVNAILDKRGTPGAGLEVIREIAAGYAELRCKPDSTLAPAVGSESTASGPPETWVGATRSDPFGDY